MAFATAQTGKDKYTGYSLDGRPIAVTKRRGFPVKQKHHNGKWWPEEIRTDAAALWAATRDFQTVSSLTNVPIKLLKEWQSEPWWTNVVSRVVKDKNDVLDQRLTEVIHKCTEQLQERLLSGDVKIYKGELFNVPIDARNLAMVMGILFDKRQMVRGEATSRTETISPDKRLAQLQEAFIQFSKATQIEGVKVEQEEPQDEATGQGEPQALPEVIEQDSPSVEEEAVIHVEES